MTEIVRRALDLLAAVVGLLLLAPLFLVIAIVIRVDSPGNPFYGGLRVGLDGRRFRMWKFRTMVSDADRIGGGITGAGDSRITRIGTFLRRTKIDELPQLVNLLLGDMTLVGPRPEVPHIVAMYTEAQRGVLRVKPGITSPESIYYTHETEASIPAGMSAEEFYIEHLLGPKLERDLDYVRHRSAMTDFRTVVATALLVAKTLTGLRR